MRTLNRWLQKLELAAGAALVLGILILASVNIVFRYAFNSPIMWSDEASSFGLIWITFIAIPYMFSINAHVSLTLAQNRFGFRMREALKAFNNAAAIVLFAVMAPSCVNCIRFLTPSPALRLNQAYVFIILPVSYCLIMFHGICNMAENVAAIRRGRDGTGERERTWN